MIAVDFDKNSSDFFQSSQNQPKKMPSGGAPLGILLFGFRRIYEKKITGSQES